MRRQSNLLKYVIGGIGVLALVLLIRDFNSRMADLRKLAADKQKVSAQVTSLVATQYFLETQVAYSSSDEAVREYAYEAADMQQPDDHLAIPVAAPGENPEPTPEAAPTAVPVQNWQLWMALFVDPQPAGHTP